MSEEAREIKARVRLKDLLERDGVEVRRSGVNWMCCCPVHNDRTPSCVLHEDDGGDWFRCFGCGAGGDVFSYWAATRKLDLKSDWAQILASLGAFAGLSPGVVAPPLPPRESKVREAKVVPLSEEKQRRWIEGVEYLAGAEAEIARIAEWRGYRPETVRVMVERGLIGMPIWKGKRHVAFPVVVPEGGVENEESFLAGYHVHTPELAGKFRFEPYGIGAWPFVIGEVETCRAIVILEGQWDAIAFYDAVSQGSEFPKDVAIIGVRGSSTWKRVLFYEWAKTVQAYVFTDGDASGMEWLEPEKLAGELRGRCRAVHCFTWATEGDSEVKDFNDAHRHWASKLSGEDWREFLRAWWRAGARTRLSRKGEGGAR